MLPWDWMPLPASDTDTDGVSRSLLVIVRDPASAPVPPGVYVTEAVAEAPGVSVTGKAGPPDVSVKSALVVELRLQLAVQSTEPMFRTVEDSAADAPTITEPKFSDWGVISMLQAVGISTTPVPVRLTTMDG
jgi:hypothetical protein